MCSSQVIWDKISPFDFQGFYAEKADDNPCNKIRIEIFFSLVLQSNNSISRLAARTELLSLSPNFHCFNKSNDYNTAIMQYHVHINSINKKQKKNLKRVKSYIMS